MSPRAGTDRPVVLWFAGVGWDEVRGTDRRLVDELTSCATVVWCDPPQGAWRMARDEVLRSFDRPAPGVVRIRVPTLPWSRRSGVRAAAAAQTRMTVTRVLRDLGLTVDIQVVASPIQRFLAGAGGTRVYYQTDDWDGGAGLMGLSRRWVAANIRANSRVADVVCAVTDVLLYEVMGRDAPVRPGTIRRVLANGCYPVPTSPASLREPVAGLVGQLNERLDLEMVGAVVDSGIPVRVVGPRRDQDPAFGRALSRLLGAPGVEYLGPVPAEEVPGQLARMGVGLTPYALTPFNRSSFPLKTLEYLSAGMAVVSTDLPAVRWLETDLVSVGTTPERFAGRVREALRERGAEGPAEARRDFAARHTWTARAGELVDLAAAVPERGQSAR